MQIALNSLTTHYQVLGQGPVVVMLHGWGCDWQIWSPIITELSKQYRLLIPDLPAFGHSDTPKSPWSSQEYVEWLYQFLESVLPNQSVILLGHSFGGKIAALFTASYPQRVTKLILTAASGIPDPLTTRQRVQQQIARLIPVPLKQALPAAWKSHILSKLQAATDHFHSTPAQQAILKKIVRENIRLDLAKIHCPTLLLWGDNDHDTPLHQGEVFEKSIAGSEFVRLANVGHFTFIDQPALFLQIVEDFLKTS